MEKDFANIISAEDMTIGYIPGSNKVLFIKTGQGGTIYGYDNKYLDLAFEVNEKYGFSVFVSAATVDTKESFQRDIKTVEDTFGTTDFEIYYMGVSKGGLIGIWHGCDEQRIIKMVSINAPLMINFHGKTLPGIKNLAQTSSQWSTEASIRRINTFHLWISMQIFKSLKERIII